MMTRMTASMEQIARSYPSLARQLSELPADEASDRHFMEELGNHVVDLFEARRSEEIRPAFSLAERMIAEGSQADRHAAVFGFLETIQNVASHRECGAAAFTEFLGPQSQAAWSELNEIWRGKTSLAELVAAETGARLDAPWWQFWRRKKRKSAREMLEGVESPELRKIIEQITRE